MVEPKSPRPQRHVRSESGKSKHICGHSRVQSYDTEAKAAVPFTSKRQPDRYHRIQQQAVTFGRRITPYLPRYMQPGGLDPYTRKLHATSWLDAARGYAAVIVMTYHYFPLRHMTIFQLPFIATLWSGKGMINVFFVISGFVLSQRMLTQIHTQQKSKLMESLASSVFRRYLRLYIPCLAVTFVSMIMVYLGLQSPGVPRKSNFFAQLWHWIISMWTFCNPFGPVSGYWTDGIVYTNYSLPLWTIPVEFRGSMIVYIFCAGTAKLSSKHRMILCALTSFFTMSWQETYVAMFLMGVFLAELSLLRFPERYVRPVSPLSKEERPRDLRKTTESQSMQLSHAGYCVVFLICFFLLGQPLKEYNKHMPWRWTLHLIPSYWNPSAKSHFLAAVASPPLIWAIDSWEPLQKPFLGKVSQYIGELSFGIYALHLTIIFTLAKNIWEPFIRLHMHNSLWGYALFLVIDAFIIVAIADYFDRLDKKVVRLGRQMQTKYFETW